MAEQHIGGKDQKEYMAEYYQKNRERLIQRAAENRKKNPERYRATHKQWELANPERVRGYKRKWDKANKEQKARGERRREATPEGKRKRCEISRRYRQNNPGAGAAKKRESHYRRKYGITIVQRDQLFEAQGRCCRICKSPNSSRGRGFHVDHCHRTKKIRGILCHFCNLLLGNAKDNITTLEAAIEYLKGN